MYILPKHEHILQPYHNTYDSHQEKYTRPAGVFFLVTLPGIEPGFGG